MMHTEMQRYNVLLGAWPCGQLQQQDLCCYKMLMCNLQAFLPVFDVLQ
jgi:hypothetical protein